jgi:hypothetical protein
MGKLAESFWKTRIVIGGIQEEFNKRKLFATRLRSSAHSSSNIGKKVPFLSRIEPIDIDVTPSVLGFVKDRGNLPNVPRVDLLKTLKRQFRLSGTKQLLEWVHRVCAERDA